MVNLHFKKYHFITIGENTVNMFIILLGRRIDFVRAIIFNGQSESITTAGFKYSVKWQNKNIAKIKPA